MEPTWFVVADQSQAQLYKVKGTRLDPELEEVECLEHPEARESNASSSGMHFSYVDTDGPSEEEQRRFIRQVVEKLKRARERGEFSKLYIAAPANFIGKARNLYGNALAQTITKEIVGDYTNENQRAFTNRIKKRAWLRN